MAPELRDPEPGTVPSSGAWLWAVLVLALAVAMAAGFLWKGGSAVVSLPADPAVPEGWSVPDFTLTDQDGRAFGRSDLLGRPWVASFIFTRCTTLCPRVTDRMMSLQRDFPRLTLVSFTVDPDADKPGVLRGYAQAHGARWRFLTGERVGLYRLIGEDGFRLSVAPNLDPAAKDLITHSDRLVLVDAGGAVRGTYSAAEGEAMARLRRDLAALGAP